jgi:hypothetical protein
MASSKPRASSVDLLLEEVERLSLAEQREFQRRLAARQVANGGPGSDEATLIRTARARLPVEAERRLRRLIAKSERGQLTPKELTAYQALAQEAQRIDDARAEALAELARLRGQSVQAVQTTLAGRTDSP